MNIERLKQLIKNLRRGDNLEESKKQFFAELRDQEKMKYWCETLSLRWLVSVADTFIDHGTPTEARNAMMISIYFNLVKIADTSRLLTTPDRALLPRLLEDVVFMYDEVNSFKITDGDMTNALFFRIDKLMQPTPILNLLFDEVKKRLAKHSGTMQIADYHNDFYKKSFFENRKTFLITNNSLLRSKK